MYVPAHVHVCEHVVSGAMIFSDCVLFSAAPVSLLRQISPTASLSPELTPAHSASPHSPDREGGNDGENERDREAAQEEGAVLHTFFCSCRASYSSIFSSYVFFCSCSICSSVSYSWNRGQRSKVKGQTSKAKAENPVHILNVLSLTYILLSAKVLQFLNTGLILLHRPSEITLQLKELLHRTHGRTDQPTN